MEALIKEKLHEIEQRENCRILLAVSPVAVLGALLLRTATMMCASFMCAPERAISGSTGSVM